MLSAVALAASGLVQAQAPAARGSPSPGVVEVSGEKPVDPERAKVERADAAVRDIQGAEITDPTVFVKSAALGALAEVALAKLAQSRSQDANLRNFAARMRTGHEAIYGQLSAVAKREKLDVPADLVYEDEQTVSQGAEKSGTEFDTWYADRMVAEHLEAIALYQRAAKMDDTKLAEFAKKTLPTLTEHLRMARALRP
jgi:putative membrane protein